MADEIKSPVPPPPSIGVTPPTYQVFDENDVKGKFVGTGDELMNWMKDQPGRTLALRVRTPDGKTGTQRADKFKPLQDQGWRIVPEDPGNSSVHEVIKQLRERDSGAISRFLDPILQAVSSLDPRENFKLHEDGWKRKVESTLKTTLGPILYPAVGSAIMATINLPENFVAAAKASPATPIPPAPKGLGNVTGPFSPPGAVTGAYEIAAPAVAPGAGEVSAVAISSLPIPFAPQIAQATEKGKQGNIAGALGELTTAGGMWLVQNLLAGAAKAGKPGEVPPPPADMPLSEQGIQNAGKWMQDNVFGPLDAKTPTWRTFSKVRQNMMVQQILGDKIKEISPKAADTADLNHLKNVAGAEVHSDNMAELDRQEAVLRRNRLADHDRIIDDIYEKSTKIDEDAAREQARRERAHENLQQLFDSTVGPGKDMIPLEAANEVLGVIRENPKAIAAVQSAVYELAYALTRQANLQTDLEPTANTIVDALRSKMPAQGKLGVSSVAPQDIESSLKMIAGIKGMIDEYGQDVSPSRVQAARSLLDAATPDRPVRMFNPRYIAELRVDPRFIQIAQEEVGDGGADAMINEMRNDRDFSYQMIDQYPEVFEGVASRVSANDPNAVQPRAIPFDVAREAQGGLSSIIRKMEAQHSPELAPRIRLMRIIRDSVAAQNDAALASRPELFQAHELLDQADRITFEKHENLDKKVIRNFFGNPRHAAGAETLVRKILSPGTEMIQAEVTKALTPGPVVAEGIEMLQDLDPEKANKLAQKIADATSDSEAAKSRLRRMVVQQMAEAGTVPSTRLGVEQPELNYNRMDRWLRSRPGAKILLGDSYDTLLGEISDKAHAELRTENPSLDYQLQRLQAMLDAEERQEAKMGAKRTAAEEAPGRIKPKEEARWLAMKPVTMAEMAQDMIEKPSRARYVAGIASPEVRQQLLRSVIDQVANKPKSVMVMGRLGGPDGIIHLGNFADEMKEAAPTIAALSDGNVAATQLQGLARAMEQANFNAKSGIFGKIYLFTTSLITRSVRGSAGVREAEALRMGPKDVIKKGITYREPQVWGAEPRNIEDDLTYAASKDPSLITLMQKALKTPPNAPGAGVQIFKYYLAFAGGRGKQAKILDEKTAQDFLMQTGGNVPDAVAAAQAQGYTR